jgi:hypothetical protein
MTDQRAMRSLIHRPVLILSQYQTSVGLMSLLELGSFSANTIMSKVGPSMEVSSVRLYYRLSCINRMIDPSKENNQYTQVRKVGSKDSDILRPQLGVGDSTEPHKLIYAK